jgi:hypothetical protein
MKDHSAHVPIRNPDCFFIDRRWQPSSDARIDVIAPAT